MAASTGTAASLATGPALARAEVQAGGLTTQYLRTGSGDLVIFLGDTPCTPRPDPLFEALGEVYRVVTPDPVPPTGAGVTGISFSTWLRGFLDGLGAGETSIVTRDRHALAALAFSLTEIDRVRKLVLCFHDAPDPLDSGSPTAEHIDDARCRILLVRETTTPEAGGPDARYRMIVDFLRHAG